MFDGGAAQAAGLSAGDVLVALDGLKVTGKTLDALLARRMAGETVQVHAFRRDELKTFSVILQAPLQDTACLTEAPRCSAAARALLEGWLGA